MNSQKISVIIPVHNSVHWLAWCLEELFKLDLSIVDKIIVVDDRSDEEEFIKLEEIVKRFAGIYLIRNNSSICGFGHACNLGAKNCHSDFLLFLNTDCFLTKGVLDKLMSTFHSDDKVVLACPLSNNSADLSYKIFNGKSYLDMSDLISLSTKKIEDSLLVREAATVTGNCLMVKKSFFDSVEGFSNEWGIGYGEETDIHMKALSQGFKGVVHLGCYVYHFGGATFNNVKEKETIRKKNYGLFMDKWSWEYKKLNQRVSNNENLHYLKGILEEKTDKDPAIELDALFYLPIIDQCIGGTQTIVTICNYLIRSGLKANIALVGMRAESNLSSFKEPMLFSCLTYATNEDFLTDNKILAKVVFSSIFTSSKIVSEFCRKRNSTHVQFIQGYEGYFRNGNDYLTAINSYQYSKHIVVTSEWLKIMLDRHLNHFHECKKLPLIINTDIFFSSIAARKFDVGFVLRAASDKGQWLLLEILDRLVKLNDKNIIVFYSSQYQQIKEYYQKKNITFVDLPIDQYTIAQYLKDIKLFCDASLHEGFGLMPLEAALCGCKIITTDSGGVNDYIHDFEAQLFHINPDPTEIINLINKMLNDENHIRSKTKSKLFKALAAKDSWFEYVSDLKNKSHPTPFREINFKSYSSSLNLLYKKQKVHNYRILIKIYQKIRPFIPKRIHMAIKILILGRI